MGVLEEKRDGDSSSSSSSSSDEDDDGGDEGVSVKQVGSSDDESEEQGDMDANKASGNDIIPREGVDDAGPTKLQVKKIAEEKDTAMGDHFLRVRPVADAMEEVLAEKSRRARGSRGGKNKKKGQNSDKPKIEVLASTAKSQDPVQPKIEVLADGTTESAKGRRSRGGKNKNKKKGQNLVKPTIEVLATSA